MKALPPLKFILSGVVLTGVLGLAFHWRPARQVRLHQEHFLTSIEDRNWKKTASFLSADYHDRWGQTKAIVLARLPQVFGTFLACGLQETPVSTARAKDGDRMLTSRVRIIGSGGPIAQMVMQQSESLHEPFTFKWRHESWKPWDWALVEVDQPELQIPADLDLE
jgi:hypothetical protein